MHAELIESLLKENGKHFASAEYASIQVPTYPSGQIGAFLGRKGKRSLRLCRSEKSGCP